MATVPPLEKKESPIPPKEVGAADRAATMVDAQKQLLQLRNDTTTPREQRLETINSVRNSMEKLHGEVADELKGKTDQNLEQLLKDIDQVRANALFEERKISTVTESVMLEGREIKKDLVEGDWTVKVKYAAIVAAGAAATAWVWSKLMNVWDWAVGNKQEPGLLRKAVGFVIAGIGGVAAAIGLSRLMGTEWGGLKGKYARSILQGAGDGVGRGLKDTQELGTEGYNVFANRKNVMAVLQHREKYETNAEFIQALLLAAAQDGCGFVWDGGALYLHAGGKLLKLEKTLLWDQVGQAIEEGEVSPNLAGEMVGTYIEGVFVYATSLAALRIITLNRIGKGLSLKGMAGEAALWPVYTLTRAGKAVGVAGKTGWNITRTGIELFHPESATNLGLARKMSTLNLKVLNVRALASNAAKTPEGLIMRLDIAQSAMERLEAAEANMRLKGVLPKFHGNVNSSLQEFKNYLSGMKQDEIPLEVMQIIQREAPGKSIAALKTDDLKKIVNAIDKNIITTRLAASAGKAEVITAEIVEGATDAKNAASAAGAAADAGKAEVITAEVVEGATEAKPAAAATATAVKTESTATEAANDTLRAGDTVRSTPQTTGATVESAAVAAESAKAETQVVDQEAVKRLLKAIPKDLPPDKLMQLLEEAEKGGAILLDKPTLALIRESPGAQNILAKAVGLGTDAERVEEVTRALKAAKLGAKLRVGMNAVGIVGDVFGVYMAYADWQANNKRIVETKNPALKDLYGNAKMLYAAEGGSSAVGLAIGGYAMISSYAAGEGLLAAAGASAGMIMLPLAVALMAGRFVYNKYEGVTEEWTKDEEDWMKSSNAQLLTTLDKNGIGKQTYWQGIGHATVAEQILMLEMGPKEYDAWMEKGFQKVENANEATRWKLTRAYMRKTLLLQRKPEEEKKAFEERSAVFVKDEMLYLDRVSGGNFTKQTSLAYKNAYTHAELLAQSRDMQKNNQSSTVHIEGNSTSDGKAIDFDLKNYEELVRDAGDPIHTSAKYNVTPNDVLSAYERQQQSATLGMVDVAKHLRDEEGNPLEMTAYKRQLEQRMVMDLRYKLIDCQHKILSTDYVGWDGLFASDDATAKRVVCDAVSKLVIKEIQTQSNILCTKTGPLSIEEYNQSLTKIGAILATDPLEYQQQIIKHTLTGKADRGEIELLEPSYIMEQL